MIAYHGTSYLAWSSIRLTQTYRLSIGDNHWLGNGAYFFVNSHYSNSPIEDAKRWAIVSAWDNTKHKNTYSQYAVIKNTLDENLKIWDLSSIDGAAIFRRMTEKIYAKIKERKVKISNPMDGIIINFAFLEIPNFDYNAVKNHLYIKLTAEDRKRNINFSQPNCTAIAIRDPSFIRILELADEGDVKGHAK